MLCRPLNAAGIHIHGEKLQEQYADVPRDWPVAVVRGSSCRVTTIAASFLQREQHAAVRKKIGGMTAWEATGLPTTAT